jgi:glucosylceramidase
MRNISRGILSFLIFSRAFSADAQKVQVWLSNPDKSALFQERQSLEFGKTTTNDSAIVVNDHTSYQKMDGFGFALTGGSAQLITEMPAGERKALLEELFRYDKNNIGVSYLRVSIGASDMNDHVFSYDDLPEGQIDTNLNKFSLSEDEKNVVPVLKEILMINPKIKILGSPWSAPTWMKTNNNVKAGQLKKEYYRVYAMYFVKYIQQMKKEGINIDAITVQNEPLNDGNTPSMQMFPPDQLDFIKNYLGPLFKKLGIKTKIILFDHNCDTPEYPTSILDDKDAAKYVDGSGFHLYRGKIDALTKVHDSHPEKNLYFTEQMVVERRGFTPGVYVARLIIGAPRNWSKNVILWNLAADIHNKPHTDNGGCPVCQGAITIDSGKVTSRNIAYYVIAHASKFVRPGSVRIESTNMQSLPNVAFKTPDNNKVLIVVNNTQNPQHFSIAYDGKQLTADLNGGSVGTYVW